MSRYQLPPLANWQDFESLCRDLFADIWKDPKAQKNGRQGQPQAGVDIFGSAMGAGKEWFGVQCKLRDQFGPKGITEHVLESEATKALDFAPPIEHFIFAHTGPRDVNVQEFARSLVVGSPHLRKRLMSVSVYSWEDIQEAVAVRGTIIQGHFPQFIQNRTPTSLVSPDHIVGEVYGRSPFPECSAIFDSPEFKSAILEPLRIELRNVVTELALNAFEHGSARRCEIHLTPTAISFVDDGRAFDSVEFARQSAPDGAGLMYLKHFLAKHRKHLDARYERFKDSNRTTFSFAEKLSSPSLSQSCVILLRDPTLANLGQRQNIEIPNNCSDYFFTAPVGALHPSGFFIFLGTLLSILPSDAVLHLNLDADDLMREVLVHWLGRGVFPASKILIE